jgi:hypothetical protein
MASKDLKEFLTKSKFLLDEVDQIRFINNDKELLLDSIFLDLDETVFSKALIIEQLSLKNKAIEEEKLKLKILIKIFLIKFFLNNRLID